MHNFDLRKANMNDSENLKASVNKDINSNRNLTKEERNQKVQASLVKSQRTTGNTETPKLVEKEIAQDYVKNQEVDESGNSGTDLVNNSNVSRADKPSNSNVSQTGTPTSKAAEVNSDS